MTLMNRKQVRSDEPYQYSEIKLLVDLYFMSVLTQLHSFWHTHQNFPWDFQTVSKIISATNGKSCMHASTCLKVRRQYMSPKHARTFCFHCMQLIKTINYWFFKSSANLFCRNWHGSAKILLGKAFSNIYRNLGEFTYLCSSLFLCLSIQIDWY